ncbi:B12-binding domain-containing radical SAM protein [Chloroflexota bacterium]
MHNSSLNKGLVVLVDPSKGIQPYSNFPTLGLLCIGTFLQNHGFAVKLIDANGNAGYKKDLSSMLVNHDVLFLGVTAMTTAVPHALELSKMAKEISPKTLIVWGGPHATLFPESTLHSPFVDVVAIGDALKKSLDLAIRLSTGQSLEGIKGLGFKTDDGITINHEREFDDIEDYPVLNYDLVDIEEYITKTVYFKKIRDYDYETRVMGHEFRALPVLTGLGCPFRCAFCIHSVMNSRYRIKGAHKIAEEIKQLQSKYDVNSFVFFDEIFFLNKKRLFELLEIFENEKIKIKWRATTRADTFAKNYSDENIVRRLQDNGLRLIAMGVESGSQRLLDYLNKGIKVEDVTRSFEVLKDTGITPEATSIIFIPGETYDEMLETFSHIVKLKLNCSQAKIYTPYIYRLYPGGEIFDEMLKSYAISLPKTLEGWANLPSDSLLFIGKARPPWIDESIFQIGMEINGFYFQTFLYYFDNNNWPKNIIKSALVKLLYKIIVMRFKKKSFKFRFEPILFRLINGPLLPVAYGMVRRLVGKRRVV